MSLSPYVRMYFLQIYIERKVALDTTKCGRWEGGCKKVDKNVIIDILSIVLNCSAIPFQKKEVALVMTKLDQSSEKTWKNGVSAKIKKFTRVVLQTVKGVNLMKIEFQ